MKQLDTQLMHPTEQINVIIGRIYRSGMTTTSGGNISIRDENGNIWITPSGVDKGSLTAKDIVCIKPDGTVSGAHKPSSELPFHKAIYEARPELTAVIHAHPPASSHSASRARYPTRTSSRRRATSAAKSATPGTAARAARISGRRLPRSSRTRASRR